MLHRIMGPDGCTASVLASKDVPPSDPGEAAKIGTAKHEEAEHCLRTGFDSIDPDVSDYIDYIDDLMDRFDRDPKMLIEHPVSLHDFVPGMKGTADCIIIPPGEVHIVDFKSGSMRVDPNSPQLKAYALGALIGLSQESSGAARRIKSVHLHIAQPPINHYAEYVVAPSELFDFGREMAAAAREAMDGGRFSPTPDNCRYCPFAPQCPALHDQMHEVAMSDFADPPAPQSLTEEQIARVVEYKPMIETWLRTVYKYALEQAQAGNTPKGLKLVSGRSQRRWKKGAEDELEALLGDEAFERKPIGITKADKLLDKETMSRLTTKPAGSPSLVLDDDDGRPALSPVADDFDAT
jgi:hypothetical protein